MFKLFKVSFSICFCFETIRLRTSTAVKWTRRDTYITVDGAWDNIYKIYYFILFCIILLHFTIKIIPGII